MDEAKVPIVGMSMEGRILVARPDFRESEFDLSLTLVLEHSAEGALGVVINQPSLHPMTESFPDWEDLSGELGYIFEGGPVDQDALIALGKPSRATGELVLGAHPIDLDEQPALVAAEGVSEVRVFAGYSGWDSGQLENELANDLWWVVNATVDDLFTSCPEDLWSQVLRRQGGELALFAHYPADPNLN